MGMETGEDVSDGGRVFRGDGGETNLENWDGE